MSDKPIVVLVNPQLGQNIGKAARAMLNFGLTEMRLVAPRDGWPNPEAGPAASGADIVLDQAKVYDTTAEALADVSLVFASTVRRRELKTPVVGPEDMAREIHANEGKSAILFGPERSGLTGEDVNLAQRIVTVPINPEFGSLNLAQAVILLAYEWSRQAGDDLAQPTMKDEEPRAPMGELNALIDHLDGALDQRGYFFPEDRAEATRTTIRTILTKPGWSSREIGALFGIVKTLEKPPKG
ncbi:RNA methyltransferase [Sphingomicrobium sediminis]|uniref:tRNA (cytidine/uridine-2'-O-)-methyltransferase TrmJ n=1 Tax=Sphingomicrobium sediminis TaxID=2950949 RepID=A0A9X2J1B4_9SPHN|nr:RNA methyltransferase [Sphingomicrobium sediminis]MCM8557093.1 RNA methyltransferase [Sphingomicrobium sediminis]